MLVKLEARRTYEAGPIKSLQFKVIRVALQLLSLTCLSSHRQEFYYNNSLIKKTETKAKLGE